jgi:hypothetical protein
MNEDDFDVNIVVHEVSLTTLIRVEVLGSWPRLNILFSKYLFNTCDSGYGRHFIWLVPSCRPRYLPTHASRFRILAIIQHSTHMPS